jgi:hypothetical protein
MPHRGGPLPFGKQQAPFVRVEWIEDDAMINWTEIGEWATAFMVVISGALAGHYAAQGMTAIQWAGAICAILGSVSLAVGVRIWPAQQKAKTQRARD